MKMIIFLSQACCIKTETEKISGIIVDDPIKYVNKKMYYIIKIKKERMIIFYIQDSYQKISICFHE